MHLLLLLCSVVLGKGKRFLINCKCFFMITGMCWNCIYAVWQSCDSNTKASALARIVLGFAWEDLPLFQRICQHCPLTGRWFFVLPVQKLFLQWDTSTKTWATVISQNSVQRHGCLFWGFCATKRGKYLWFRPLCLTRPSHGAAHVCQQSGSIHPLAMCQTKWPISHWF